MRTSRSQLLAAVASAACVAALPRALRAQAASLRVAATANDTYAEAYYARDLGSFTQAGLAVDVQTFTAGGPVTAAVAGGAADIGIAGAPTIAAARGRGIPFVFLASGGLYSADHPATGIVVADGPALRTAADLHGKTLAVGAIKDGNWLAAAAWIDQHGGDSTRVRFIELPFAEMGPAIKRGTIAGGTIPEPSQTRALHGGGLRVFAHHFDVYGRQAMIGGWFARRDWVDAHRDLARRFVDVIYATGRWANAHPADSGAILAKVAKLDAETVRTMIRSRYGEALEPPLFQTQLDLSFTYRILERQVNGADLIADV